MTTSRTPEYRWVLDKGGSAIVKPAALESFDITLPEGFDTWSVALQLLVEDAYKAGLSDGRRLGVHEHQRKLRAVLFGD